MDIKQINSAIITGNFTNDELNSIIDAIKFKRTSLQQQARYVFRNGSSVKFTSTKTRQTVHGVVTKIAQKYATVMTSQGNWRVPMNMLEAA